MGNQLPTINLPFDAPEWARALKEILETRNGLRGDSLDRGVTFRDLVDAGIASLPAITVPSSGGGGTPSDISLPIVIADLSPPPALTGLTATGALSNILLGWNLPPNTSNYAYTEIWRASTNTTVANAALLDTTTASVYANTVGASGVTYWYWIRGVSKQGQKGAFNAVAGVSAATGTINGVDLTNLIIDASKLATGAVTSTKIAAAAVGTAAIANAAITNALIGSLAVDTAQIATGAITNAKIGSLAVDTAQINTGAITNAKIGTAAVDTLQIAGDAVTVPVGVTSAALYTATISYVQKLSAAINALGQPVMLTVSIPFYLYVTGSSSLGNFILLKVKRDGTDIFAIDGTLGWAAAGGSLVVGTVSGVYSAGIIALTLKDAPATGSHTYTVEVAKNYSTGTAYTWNMSMQLLGVKR